jgi:hypothetical protein
VRPEGRKGRKEGRKGGKEIRVIKFTKLNEKNRYDPKTEPLKVDKLKKLSEKLIIFI